MKFKKIIGGNQKEALEKFPWLKRAEFKGAVIDITGKRLLWKNGEWISGAWGEMFVEKMTQGSWLVIRSTEFKKGGRLQ